MFNEIQMPLLRLPPWFPGTYSVPGADVQEGIRQGTKNIVLYVDPDHYDANDSNDGTNPNHPLAHIQAAVDKLQAAWQGGYPWGCDGDVIWCAPADYAESVVTYDYADGPGYVTIMGGGGNKYGPYWESDAVALPCLDLRAPGFRVQGFRFAAPTQAACIEMHHTDLGGLDIAINTLIYRNHFYGQTTGRYGIASHGCYEVWIVENEFENFHNAVAGGARAIVTLPCPLAIPFRNHIIGNQFYENDNHIDGEFNGSIVAYNTFQAAGIGYSAARKCFLNGGVGSGGNDNLVYMNFMPGDYSIVGGYSGPATDHWNGNMADDVAEAEVADNGWTIAVPT